MSRFIVLPGKFPVALLIQSNCFFLLLVDKYMCFFYNLVLPYSLLYHNHDSSHNRPLVVRTEPNWYPDYKLILQKMCL